MYHRKLSATLSLIAAVLFTCGLVPTAARAGDRPLLGIQARAHDSRPHSRIEADQAMDGAVAASVIGAISSQFSERSVAVKLDRVAVQPVSVRDRTVSGVGRLRIGNDMAWIPFRFDVLYDTREASAVQPAITLGDTPATHELPLGSMLAQELDRQVGAALTDEFSQQTVQLMVERITTTDAGPRYLRVEARGIADFAAEGSTPARVQGLYDRRMDEWVRVDYELGATSNWAKSRDAVAAR